MKLISLGSFEFPPRELQFLFFFFFPPSSVIPPLTDTRTEIQGPKPNPVKSTLVGAHPSLPAAVQHHLISSLSLQVLLPSRGNTFPFTSNPTVCAPLRKWPEELLYRDTQFDDNYLTMRTRIWGHRNPSWYLAFTLQMCSARLHPTASLLLQVRALVSLSGARGLVGC